MVKFLRYFQIMMIGTMVCSNNCSLNAMKQANSQMDARTTLTTMNFSPFSYNMAYWHAKVRDFKEKVDRQIISDELVSEAQSLVQEVKAAGQVSFAKQIEEIITKAKQEASNQSIAEHEGHIEHYKKIYGEQSAQNKSLEDEIAKLRAQLSQITAQNIKLRQNAKKATAVAQYYKKAGETERQRAKTAAAKIAEQDKIIEWLQQEHQQDNAYNQQLALELNKTRITLHHAQKEIAILSDEIFLLKTEVSVSENMLQIASDEKKKLMQENFDNAKYATSIYNREAKYVKQIQQLKQELAESQKQDKMPTDHREDDAQNLTQLSTTSSQKADMFNQLKNENTVLHQSIVLLQEEITKTSNTSMQLKEQFEQMAGKYTRLCNNIMRITTGKVCPERAITEADLQQIDSKINSLAGLSITVKKLDDNIMKVLASPDAQKYKAQIVKSLDTIKQALIRNKL